MESRNARQDVWVLSLSYNHRKKSKSQGSVDKSANMKPSLAQVSETTRPVRKCLFITAAHRTLH